MAVVDTINSIKTHLGEAYASLEEKGADIPENKNIENLADSILSVPSGGGSAEDYIYLDKTVTGTSGSNVNWGPLIKKIIVKHIRGTTARYLFYNFYGEEIDMANCIIDNTVTNMSNLCYGCASLIKINLSNIDTSNITTMASMFNGCSKLEEIIGIENLNTENVTNFVQTFYRCSVLKELNLSNWKVQNLTSGIGSMFYLCKGLKKIDGISNWDVSNCTSFTEVFTACSKLQELDLSGWQNNIATNYTNFLSECTSLKKIDIRGLEFNNVTTTTQMLGTGNYAVPYDCLIIVKDSTQKTWFNTKFSYYTNVKTVEEYEAS